ncbi:MAG: GntR family transcriptional regulator [Planctomycetota bacterium]|jgi:DNA-binding LacI/PurR family transcriptional regulator
MQHTRNTPRQARGGRTAVGLADEFRGRIADGSYPGGQFMPPVRVLAREHGAAAVTVHRALKMLASEGLVVSQPRHGYRVCPGAGDPDRGLPVAYVNSTEHRIGSGRDEFHRTLLAEFQAVAASRGWSLLTIDAGSMTSAQAVEQVAAANCCGVMTNSGRGELWAGLRASGVATVLVDAWNSAVDVDCVLQDGFRGGMRACTHLVERGHTEITWLGPALDVGNAQILERYGGAVAAMKGLGRPFTAEVEAPLGDPETARKVARDLLKRKKRPGAILALWQDMTVAVAEAARELDLAPGKDFAMVGWCTEEEYDSFFTPLFDAGKAPPAVTWSISRMADAAVARLKQRRAEPGLDPVVVRIPTRLREGDRRDG